MRCEAGSFPVLKLHLHAKRPVLLRVKGYDAQRNNTIFFDRTYGSVKGKFKGSKWFEFPLPLAPDKLKFEFTDASTGSSRHIQELGRKVECMKPVGLQTDAETKEFIEFAADFAVKAGYLSPGEYTSPSRSFVIRYMDQIRNHETGEVLNTPARVSHMTGIMEASKVDFEQISVPNRLVILLHEYFHIYGNTTNEMDCDRFALNIALKMGFSKTECLYTLSKLFLYEKPEPGQPNAHMSWTLSMKEKEERVKRAKDFIMVFQQQHG